MTQQQILVDSDSPKCIQRINGSSLVQIQMKTWVPVASHGLLLPASNYLFYCFFTARTSSQGDSSKELYFIMYMMVFSSTGVTCRGSIGHVISTHVVGL